MSDSVKIICECGARVHCDRDLKRCVHVYKCASCGKVVLEATQRHLAEDFRDSGGELYTKERRGRKKKDV